MAIIPGGIVDLSAAILSYVITALYIAAIIKFVQAIMSIGGEGGLGNLFGGGDNKDNKDKGDGDGKGNKKTPIDKIADKVLKDKFNPYITAKVKCLVTDQHDNPIEGAYVTIKPSYARQRNYWLIPKFLSKNKNTWREYNLPATNADGYTPSRDTFETIGTGTVTIRVVKQVKVTHPIKKIFVQYKNYESIQKHKEIEPDQEHFFTFKLEGIVPIASNLEPKITNVEADMPHQKLILEGEIQ